MPAPTEQAFLNELDKKLWTAADPAPAPGYYPRSSPGLRSSLHAAVYKQTVLGLH